MYDATGGKARVGLYNAAMFNKLSQFDFTIQSVEVTLLQLLLQLMLNWLDHADIC